MGVCASCHNVKRITTTRGGNVKGGVGVGVSVAPPPSLSSESFRRPSSIMLMNISTGSIKEYNQPIPANVVVSENSNNNTNCYYISNAESMCIGTCMPRVPDEEELLPGRIYFLVPISHSNFPLSLPLLCDLAVKVSSALATAHR
ncbi:uncharacterized protein [Cicer arietinum]|uniref:Uncharacterized protein LOC105851093 n=1 Tax=Cicer arietinum TaxID=3827 RepID=A0A1S3EFE1_CICAR|nr:uncharacterized protein LOC105851093 [Cicer arietinum]XP_027193312.1 uncharacterized protein LOC105851093 [Cicer arietinum]